ncbi:MAG: NAD(+) diphosphatase [bacterium]|nr:NAD(+) diphosphatase [bacterium]
MIQDIAPHAFYNEFEIHDVREIDYVIAIRGNDVYMDGTNNQIKFPTYQELKEICADPSKYSYLFKVDETRYFLYDDSILEEEQGYQYINWNVYREFGPMHQLLAATVGNQIGQFYKGHTFCGQCGRPTIKSTKERAVICTTCNKTVYPTISPSVIVAITNKNQLLLTKYAYGPYKKYALVAGYSEVGESVEQTVFREVMEEVGLAVKNMRYYKSQPWACSNAMLMGYFVEVDGDPTITLQEEELKEATWFTREDLPETTSTISLTNEMIEYFRKHPEEFN